MANQVGDKVVSKKIGVKVYATPDASNPVTFESGSPLSPVYNEQEVVGTFIRSQSYSRFLWHKVKAIRKYQVLKITKNGIFPVISYEDRTSEFEGWVRNTDVDVIAQFVVPNDSEPDTEPKGNEPETPEPEFDENGNPIASKTTGAAKDGTTTTTNKTLTTVLYVTISVLVTVVLMIIFRKPQNQQ